MSEAHAAAKAGARPSFYHWMALTCLAVAVIGFLPTYFAPLAQGNLHTPPIIHVHGALFFAWIVFFCAQTWLAGSGRIMAHREWGLLGVAIATAMAFSVVATFVMRLNQGGPPQLVWTLVASLLYFEICVAAALANTRRPETHKRFMLLGTISIVNTPIGRWVFALLPPTGGFDPLHPPLTALLPSLIASLLIVAAMIFDWRTRGRVSPIYVIGLAVYLLLDFTVTPIGATPAWLAIASWFKGFGG